jgi:hypothetical protein
VSRRQVYNAGLLLNASRVFFYVGESFINPLQAAVTPHQWTHVVAAYSASESGGLAKLYINGQLKGQRTGIGACVFQEREFEIGRYSGNDDDDRISAQVDEIQVWSRMLSDEEAFIVARTQVGSSDSDLRLYLVAEGDTAYTAVDRSTYGNNGEFVSNPKQVLLDGIYFAPNCKGCFGESFPRCSPYTSVDTCGDGVVTGLETCE